MSRLTKLNHSVVISISRAKQVYEEKAVKSIWNCDLMKNPNIDCRKQIFWDDLWSFSSWPWRSWTSATRGRRSWCTERHPHQTSETTNKQRFTSSAESSSHRGSFTCFLFLWESAALYKVARPGERSSLKICILLLEMLISFVRFFACTNKVGSFQSTFVCEQSWEGTDVFDFKLLGKMFNQSIKFYLYSPYSQTTVRLIGL